MATALAMFTTKVDIHYDLIREATSTASFLEFLVM
jgi:hypothetical protein